MSLTFDNTEVGTHKYTVRSYQKIKKLADLRPNES